MNGTVVIAASNVQGLGALQLVRSLLPALAQVGNGRLGDVFVPDHGPLGALTESLGLRPLRLHRRLPNAVSRVAECLFSSRIYPGGGNLLVLGDLPLAVRGKQVLLIHRPHVITGADAGSTTENIKVMISRALVRRGAHHVHRVIVQSEPVAQQLRANFPQFAGRIAIIPQPAPDWLQVTDRARWDGTSALRLFYPASAYPHKNHALLSRYMTASAGADAPHVHITLTSAADRTLAAHPMVEDVGILDAPQMCLHYGRAHALTFPSLEESYGLPLVEAMTLGLPILVADRPYARSLCGDAALYFDPQSEASLAAAIGDLQQRLRAGWTPDYAARLALIPATWADVATRILALFDAA